MKVRWMVAGLVLWIMHGVVYADAAQLQMNEAFRLALTHPSVVARSSELGAAQQRLVAAQWQRFPTLSALTGKDQSQNGYATVRLDQPLWTGGRITAGIDSAEASVRGAEAAVLESHQDILTRAVAAFTEFGRLHTRMVTSRSNVAEHERLYKLIDRRVQSEVSSSSDGVLARARLAAARAELGQFEAQSGRARSQLEQIVGRSFERIELPAMPSLRQKTLLEMTDAALEYSPALRRRTAEEEAAQAEIGIRQGNLWPQVKARYERTNGSTLMAREQVYIALEYQPGAGMSSLSGVQEAVARREAAQAVRETARRELLDTIATDWASYQSLKSQGRDQLAQVESTSDVFDSFVRQYAVGRKSWIDVLNAQRELVSARYALADVEWGMMRDTLRLQIFSGELSAANLGASAGRGTKIRCTEFAAENL
ncbi:MAG: TolC family protein, partial [Betaproteobacteria bacterium]